MRRGPAKYQLRLSSRETQNGAHGGGPVLFGPGQEHRAGIVWHLAGDLAARAQGDLLKMGFKPCAPPDFESEPVK